MTLRYPEHPGPDHDWYEHRRAATHAGISWPGGLRTAAFVLLRVQALEVETPTDIARDPRWRIDFGNFSPEYRSHSLIDYGSRVGIFRLLDLLQPLGWHIAAAVNGLVAQENPGLVRQLAQRGVTIVASGWSASRMLSSAVPPEAEMALMRQSFDAIAQATGASPVAYSSQDYGYSRSTPEILEALGVATAIDWPNDETPYLFGRNQKILMLPSAAELDDAQMMVGRRLQSTRWGSNVRAALDYWRECARHGSVFVLPLHAWISGAPHRYTNLRKALDGFDPAGFWQASPQAIDAAWRAGQHSGAQ